MTDWTSVLWKLLIQLAKKWPEMVLQQPFIILFHFRTVYILELGSYIVATYVSEVSTWEKKPVGIFIWFRVQRTFKFWYFFWKPLWCELFVNSIWAAYHAPTHHTQHSTLHLWCVSSTLFGIPIRLPVQV